MAKITPEIDSQFPRQQIDKIDMESTMAACDAILKHSVLRGQLRHLGTDVCSKHTNAYHVGC